jgi:hypothetical protein
LVVETLRATSLPPHLFVLFVLFVVPARTLPSESKRSVREPGSLTHPQVTPIEGADH